MLDMAADLAEQIEVWRDLWVAADREYGELPAPVRADIADHGMTLERAVGFFATVVPEERAETIAALGRLLDVLRDGVVTRTRRVRRHGRCWRRV